MAMRGAKMSTIIVRTIDLRMIALCQGLSVDVYVSLELTLTLVINHVWHSDPFALVFSENRTSDPDVESLLSRELRNACD